MIADFSFFAPKVRDLAQGKKMWFTLYRSTRLKEAFSVGGGTRAKQLQQQTLLQDIIEVPSDKPEATLG